MTGSAGSQPARTASFALPGVTVTMRFDGKPAELSVDGSHAALLCPEGSSVTAAVDLDWAGWQPMPERVEVVVRFGEFLAEIQARRPDSGSTSSHDFARFHREADPKQAGRLVVCPASSADTGTQLSVVVNPISVWHDNGVAHEQFVHRVGDAERAITHRLPARSSPAAVRLVPGEHNGAPTPPDPDLRVNAAAGVVLHVPLVLAGPTHTESKGTVPMEHHPDGSAGPAQAAPRTGQLPLMLGVELPNGQTRLCDLPSGAGSPLTALRAALGKDVTSGDHFVVGGLTVSADQESRLSVEAAFPPETLLGELPVVKMRAGNASPGPARSDGVPQDRTEVFLQRLRGGASQELRVYTDLTYAERDHLFQHVNMCKGVSLSGQGLLWSSRRCARIDGPPQFEIPAETIDDRQSVSDNLLNHELHKRTIAGGELSARSSTIFTDLHVKATLETTKQLDENSTSREVFVHSERLVPKVVLILDEEQIKLVDPLEKAFSSWLTACPANYPNPASAAAQVVKLVTILNRWGFYLATRFIVGGALFVEDRLTIRKDESEAAALQHATLSLGIKLYSLEADARLRLDAQERERSSRDSQSRFLALQALGGDPAAAGDPTAWIASLGRYDTWRLCRVGDFIPLPLLHTDAKNLGTAIRNAVVTAGASTPRHQVDLTHYSTFLVGEQPTLDSVAPAPIGPLMAPRFM